MDTTITVADTSDHTPIEVHTQLTPTRAYIDLLWGDDSLTLYSTPTEVDALIEALKAIR